MTTLFNSVLTAFGKFFARSFWLGAFVPVATIAALHLLIASQVFPRSVDFATWAVTESVSRLIVTALGLVVLAYAVSPFSSVLRGFLDGQLLWSWLREVLRRARFQSAYRAKRKVEMIGDLQEDYSRFAGDAETSLDKAAKLGLKKGAPSAAQVKAVDERVAGLRAALSTTGSAPQLEPLKAAVAVLEAVLKTSSTDKPDPESVRLARLHRDLLGVMTTADALFQTELNTLRQRWRLQWALPATEPTGMGDARRLAERYSDGMYGVNFDYVWPRLQLGLDGKSKEAETLDAAQTQLEFAVLSLALSATVPLVWLPLLALYGESLGWIVGVGLFGPLSWIFFYQLALQAQVAFGGVVQAIIDRSHLTLLDDMQLERPIGTAEERVLWARLQTGDQGGAPSIRYATPKETSATGLVSSQIPISHA